jgi:hypothetical protein
VKASTTANTASAESVAVGSRGRKAPAPVATPLPPRKRSHTGYMCPSTATTAHSAGSGLCGSTQRPSCAAAMPLPKSSTKAKRPATRPTLRITLVAPTLPLPTVRTSTPRARATRKLNGIEPSR